MIPARRVVNLSGLFMILILSCVSNRTQQVSGTVRVEAKQWSKTDGVVHYSDWKPFNGITMANLKGFKAVTKVAETRFGSDPDKKFKATGFFYAIKAGDRWWIVDPDGNGALNVSVNGVRPGSSERNEQALQEKFGTEQNWINRTHQELESLGFNGTACWSEVPLVKYSNKQFDSQLSYTIILSLFSGYHKQLKKGVVNEISFPVFDAAFEAYVDRQAQKLGESREDPALLGYFSDNELSFNVNTLDEYLAIKDQNNPQYKIAREWLGKQSGASGTISDKDREMFLGVVADQYYRIVSGAIRKYDPNHMYLGSRLHGKPKHNKYIVATFSRSTIMASGIRR